MLPNPPVMLITDAAQALLPLDDVIAQSLDAGCRWILLRDVNADDDALLAQAMRIKKLCMAFDAKCFISRNVNVAKAIGADGIHLSASQSIEDMHHSCDGMLIGQSCHSLADIIAAEKNGAHYVTLSPIFETSSKAGYGPALGISAIEAAHQQTRLPILALGGIDNQNAKSCLNAGASGIAVMGGIMRAAMPAQAMQRLLQTILN